MIGRQDVSMDRLYRGGPCHAQGNIMGPHDESGSQDSIGWAYALSQLPRSAHMVLPVNADL
jgi:hypothetical protein